MGDEMKEQAAWLRGCNESQAQRIQALQAENKLQAERIEILDEEVDAFRSSEAYRRLEQLCDELKKKVERLHGWVTDLQAGMYINCVYCGHRYGPDDKVPASMADVLKAHVEQCPDHPMSKLKAENATLRAAADLVERGSPNDIRAKGWTVAVHNDYRVARGAHTFWLFTKDGRALKGEGPTDIDALDRVREALTVMGAE